ncbi:MAG TPA: tetratricopeptide repeat protein [Clostridia bacterium]|nr:tetratricopeptide repeat protein [Clostridia bacterium]
MSFLHDWWNHRKPLAKETSQDQANLGDAEAQFLQGVKFANREDEARDYAQAVQWYEQAAAQNHALAQFNLSIMYEHGQGVARNDAKSLVWLTRAAELGDAGAQYKLGVRQHLACRNAVPGTTAETRIEALKWVRLSADQGYRGAVQACQFVTLEMTREEVAEGGRRVAAFVAGEKPGIQPEATPGE